LAIETPEEKRRRILELAKDAVSKAYSTGEHSLVQAINAYNEIERTRNLVHERLEEWYGIYFPEFAANPEQYVKFVIEAGRDKKHASMETLKGLYGEKAEAVQKRIEASIGNEPSDVEYEALKNLAEGELALIRLEKELDRFLKENVPKAMPNISYLIDYKLAAELLSKAGSLIKLANMPASTVQLLGAEKALFRHIRSGSRPPKYGVLFKLKEVTVADRRDRGRIARMFATKLSIAARADAFSKRFIGDTLKASLEKAMASMATRPHGPSRLTGRERPEQGAGRFQQGGRGFGPGRGPGGGRGGFRRPERRNK
jgi:nucleolar protein 56